MPALWHNRSRQCPAERGRLNTPYRTEAPASRLFCPHASSNLAHQQLHSWKSSPRGEVGIKLPCPVPMSLQEGQSAGAAVHVTLTRQTIRNAKLAGWLAAATGAVCLVLPFTASNASGWLVLVGLSIYAFIGWAWATRCPSCDIWAAATSSGSELLDNWTEQRDIVRVDVTRDTRGRVVSRTSRREEVTVNVEKRRHFYCCRHCANTWTVIRQHASR